MPYSDEGDAASAKALGCKDQVPPPPPPNTQTPTQAQAQTQTGFGLIFVPSSGVRVLDIPGFLAHRLRAFGMLSPLRAQGFELGDPLFSLQAERDALEQQIAEAPAVLAVHSASPPSSAL